MKSQFLLVQLIDNFFTSKLWKHFNKNHGLTGPLRRGYQIFSRSGNFTFGFVPSSNNDARSSDDSLSLHLSLILENRKHTCIYPWPLWSHGDSGECSRTDCPWLAKRLSGQKRWVEAWRWRALSARSKKGPWVSGARFREDPWCETWGSTTHSRPCLWCAVPDRRSWSWWCARSPPRRPRRPGVSTSCSTFPWPVWSPECRCPFWSKKWWVDRENRNGAHRVQILVNIVCHNELNHNKDVENFWYIGVYKRNLFDESEIIWKRALLYLCKNLHILMHFLENYK